MRALTIPIAAVLLSLACGRADPPEYNVPGEGGGGGGNNKSDAGATADAGTTDGGSQTCPADQDGKSAGNTLIVSELNFAAPAFLELLNGTTISQSLTQLRFKGSVAGASLSGDLDAGKYDVVDVSLSSTKGELGVYVGAKMVQYVCWGPELQQTTELQLEAMSNNLWQQGGVCVATSAATKSLHLRGLGINPADYVSADPTPGGCSR